MKKFFLTIIITTCFATAFAQNYDHLNVLFIGNSYTAVNNLPGMLVEVAKSTNDIINTASNTPGGCTFQLHTTNNSVDMIAKGNWNYVVLQEQSQLPALDSVTFFTQSYPYAKQLDSLIVLSNKHCETIFYMTWGRENGDNEYCQVFPPVCTYEGMDSLLYERYMMMAEDNNAIVSPVGAVWHELRKSYPEIELYASDGSHPSLSGSYAAACAFYTVILRKDPTLITESFSLTHEEAEIIRNVVKQVVYNNLLTWYVGKYDNINYYESHDLDINIYPNPSNGLFIIESNLFLSKQFTITIYSLTGTVVKTLLSNNIRKQKINLSELTKGIYSVVINSNDGIKISKLISM